MPAKEIFGVEGLEDVSIVNKFWMGGLQSVPVDPAMSPHCCAENSAERQGHSYRTVPAPVGGRRMQVSTSQDDKGHW